MRGLAKAFAVGLAHQLLEIRYQGAGDRPGLDARQLRSDVAQQ